MTIPRIMHIVALSLVTTLPAAFSAAVPAGTSPESIEDFIDSTMPSSAVPGLAYAVVADGEGTAAGARGVLRVGGDTAVTADTPFVIGSISKSFTALAVMQLVEAGKLDLGTAISQHLDSFSSRPAGAITIRQLLSHTSGFSTMQGNAPHQPATDQNDALSRGVEQLAGVTPANKPDEKWEYSNANYEILGRLIEVVSGQDYQSYVTSNILEPVGMEHSFVADGEIHESMATGHLPWFGTKLPLADGPTDRATAPQGGIISSANDVARYLQVMMNGENDVLSAEGKAQMMRPASDASPGYGLGWYVESDSGVIWHSGASPGVETLAIMIPAEKRAVIVLVNGGGGMGFGETDQLRIGLTDLALGLGYYDDGSKWTRQALFIGLVALPIFYLISMVWAWVRRTRIRAKLRAGVPGLVSLWFPLLATGVAAWVLLGLVPVLNGTPIDHWVLFQPDVVVAFVASAAGGVIWAVFRLLVAYTARSGTGSAPAAARSTPSST
ncbi:N/A [soil metagenome]